MHIAFFRMIPAVGTTVVLIMFRSYHNAVFSLGVERRLEIFLLICYCSRCGGIYLCGVAGGRKENRSLKGAFIRIAEGQVDYKIPLKGLKEVSQKEYSRGVLIVSVMVWMQSG